MTRELLYSPEALAQLQDLEDYLSGRAGPGIAASYIDRLVTYCDRLTEDPIVGHRRDDLVPGLMTRTFEKSRVVCFVVTPDDNVHVVAFYGTRQDWEGQAQAHPIDLE